MNRAVLGIGRVNFKLMSRCDGGINNNIIIILGLQPNDRVGDSKLTEETAQTLKTQEHNRSRHGSQERERERERKREKEALFSSPSLHYPHRNTLQLHRRS